jgi:hypothetical protein
MIITGVMMAGIRPEMKLIGRCFGETSQTLKHVSRLFS